MISSHAVATKNRAFPRWNSTRIYWKSMRFCSRSIGKALEGWTRKLCKCPLGRYWLRTQGCGVPSRATSNILLRMAEVGNHMVSPTTTKKPKKPKFGDAVGYSLKSSFYQSWLISFNSLFSANDLWLSEFYLGPSVLRSHWVTVLFKK